MIKVLLVEDEPLVRRGIRSMIPFQQFGMELIGEASSGEEALEIMGKRPVDLVFTDISMPGMDGLELIQMMRERYPSIRSVVLTCHQDFGYLQNAMRLGAIDYIVKTQVDDDSVLELLRRIVVQCKPSEQTSPSVIKPINQGELSRSWQSLIWLVDQEKFEELTAGSSANLSANDWKLMLIRSFDEWLMKCPSLAAFRNEKETLCSKDSISGIKEWLDSFRQSAQRLMRNTMYSEEVIYSIVRAIDILNEHAGERLNQADICKMINMSISYFSKCFKELVGITFVEYAQDMNIRLAQQLLQTTNYPVYQIAEQSSFSDVKYFGKIFRQKTGSSPSEFRMKFRGNP